MTLNHLTGSNTETTTYLVMSRVYNETEWREWSGYVRDRATAIIHCKRLRKTYPSLYKFEVARVVTQRVYSGVKFKE